MVDIVRHQKVERAIQLLEAGLRSPIVVIDTALPETAVRDLARQVNDNRRASSGPLPSPPYIASSRVALIEASLWAMIYLRISGRRILYEVDMNSLLESSRIYRSLRTALPERREEPLDINHLWVLARALRSDEAWLRRCKRCSVQYLLFPEPRTPAGCPLCSYKETHRSCSH